MMNTYYEIIGDATNITKVAKILIERNVDFRFSSVTNSIQFIDLGFCTVIENIRPLLKGKKSRINAEFETSHSTLYSFFHA